ncbi:hypothetical protein FE840_002560 [Peteryoungia desertarenae]|uniref:Tetratricopeptide repeat protein n=1 Tax=Peteryoungia desertarenae TaxID=1813451 RepID=A0ABX6QJJ9_9HYPH|nr:hypothetical protein [Peteryoungia desertarenae]QLF68521.1 hypothetical protein FE840_002560 [Peteryoungia desertarenae]
MDRVDREARRLSVKFPGFVLPDDLFDPVSENKVDETPLWQLYEKDDFVGIDMAISRMAADNPGWQPSVDFKDKLERRKLRFELMKSHAAQDSSRVIILGQELDPATETDVDLLWALIDAYRDQDQLEPMAPIYKGILFRGPGASFDADIVMTTLQKALKDFPVHELRQVIAILSADPDLATRMSKLQLDIIRREIADFNAGIPMATPPLPESVLAIRRTAGPQNQVSDQILLGWYYLKLERLDEAENWFRNAFANEGTAENLEGLVAVLERQARKADAFALVASHIELLDHKPETFIETLSYPFLASTDLVPEPTIAETYAMAIQSAQSATHAELLGWYAYNGRQFNAAKAWFLQAVNWKVTRDNIKGLALTSLQLKDREGLAALKQRHGSAFPDVFADLEKAAEPKGKAAQTVREPATKAAPRYLMSFQAKRYGECLADLDRLARAGQMTPEAQLIRGWCNLELNHLTEARKAFETSLSTGVRQSDDAVYGLGLSLLRARMTTDVEMLLATRPLSARRANEIRAELLWLKARDAFDRKAYDQALASLNARLQIAAEPVGMTQMRAWAHFHMGNLRQSRAIFSELNQVVDDPANRRGLAAIRERMGIDQ